MTKTTKKLPNDFYEKRESWRKTLRQIREAVSKEAFWRWPYDLGRQIMRVKKFSSATFFYSPHVPTSEWMEIPRDDSLCLVCSDTKKIPELESYPLYLIGAQMECPLCDDQAMRGHGRTIPSLTEASGSRLSADRLTRSLVESPDQARGGSIILPDNSGGVS